MEATRSESSAGLVKGRGVGMVDRIARYARMLALSACVLALTVPGFAQQPAGQPPSAQEPTPQAQTPQQTALSELEPMKLALDQIEATLRRDELPIATLGELEEQIVPVRDNLRAKLADLQTRLARLGERRQQLGPPPAV